MASLVDSVKYALQLMIDHGAPPEHTRNMQAILQSFASQELASKLDRKPPKNPYPAPLYLTDGTGVVYKQLSLGDEEK